MTSNTNAGQRNGHAYQLDTRTHRGGGVQSNYYDTLEALAWALHRAMRAHERELASNKPWSGWRDREAEATYWLVQTARASSHRGRILDIQALCAMGPSCNPYYSQRSRWSCWSYTRREGPVPGIRKWRGGGHCRNQRVMAMRRQNLGWLPEEGEVECRARHRDRYTYISRDGRARGVERSWKSQHKGRKSWDLG